ncbi:LAETG motif-containing sortase-dependent surface protein [Streptomyces sp. N35]|uniref:LAETG motif-containing sortase-dependent surface protein n=1 Tax=Streptomyces sp. N35 TaxID=2795730 RepID=UPI0018F3E94F|nr:LAETG motif-containing sortase-dependent surface protein [Streptomyces sp. N35]
MTLRRAAAFAAAAAIAPAMLLATPALAEEVDPSASAAPGVSEQPQVSPTPETEAPSATPTATESETPTAKPSPSTSVSSSPAPSPEASSSDEEAASQPPRMDMVGFPSTFAAGGNWSTFTLAVDNSKGEEIESFVPLFALAHESDKLKLHHIQLQFKAPGGSWQAADLYADDGAFFTDMGEHRLEAGKKLTIEIRLKFTAQAPAGEGISAAAGFSLDDDNIVAMTDDYEFTLLAAAGGGNRPTPDSGAKPVTDNKPAKPATAHLTGELAATGSDSTTPYLLGAGALTLAAGAGLVALGRSRRSGSRA